MKISVRQLRKLIREEVESAVGVPASGGVYQVGNWEPEVDEMLVFKTGSKAECEAAAVIMSEFPRHKSSLLSNSMKRTHSLSTQMLHACF